MHSINLPNDGEWHQVELLITTEGGIHTYLDGVLVRNPRKMDGFFGRIGRKLRSFRGPRQPLTCKCGCPEATHEHHRAGTDCGYCGNLTCPYFRNGGK